MGFSKRSPVYVKDFAIDAGSKLSCRWDVEKEITIPQSLTHLLHPGFQGSCGPLGSVSDLSVTLDRMSFVSFDCLEIPNFREVAHRSSPQKKIGVHL